MPDYQKMYCTLFNAITDAVENIEQKRCDAAKEILVRAQQETEEMYIFADD